MYHKITRALHIVYKKSICYCLSKLPILQELRQQIRLDDTIERAYAVAFNLTLAIFPATIFIFTLIPYIPIPTLIPKLVSSLKELMPEAVYTILAPTIQDTLSQQRSGLLSFGALYTLYLATNGMMSLIKNFNLVDPAPVLYKRSYLHQRVIAIVLTLAFSFSLLVSLLLLIGTRQILNYLVSNKLVTYHSYIHAFSFIRPFIILFILYVTIVSIYYIAPDNKQRRKFISIGAILAAIASLLTSLAFTYYISHFLQYSIYGSLGGMIALMLWLFLLSFIFLAGFELDIALSQIKQQHRSK